ncbi:hypothetical protein DMP17_13010 [Pseudonocardia sp. TMWB2A]
MTQSTAQQAMLCPTCRVPLSMAERQGVEIDFCPQCRGVWLDRGELDKIIERSERADASVPKPAVALRSDSGERGYDEVRRSGHHGGKRRKSFLAELFD